VLYRGLPLVDGRDEVMYPLTEARQQVDARGPRYAVIGKIRSDEARTEYADTGEQAERIRREFEQEWGYYQVHVYPPDGSLDLTSLATERRRAQTAEREATAKLRAGVLRALEAGRAEAEVARQAGVDRMTVRSWAGKH
jgi:hypothetical protein